MIHGNVTEFTRWELEILLETYIIEPNTTTAKNTRADGIVERNHLTMGDILRTANFTVLHFQEDTTTILKSVSRYPRITVHTTDIYYHRKKFLTGILSYR